MTCWTPTCDGHATNVVWDEGDNLYMCVCGECAYNAVTLGGELARRKELTCR
jgi:hypothetical protein